MGHETFAPTIDQVLGASRRQQHPVSAVAAFVSLDYRLSPHPEFPQDPAATPARRFRGARHPDHLDDVLSALAYLQAHYAVGGRYVLVGHSCGACLALQVVGMSTPSSSSSSVAAAAATATATATGRLGAVASASAAAAEAIVLPQAIIGFEGIYDLAGLNARMSGGYAGFLTGAFGDNDDGGWDAVSPMKFPPGSFGGERWRDDPGKLVALGWSPEDDLIDELEIDGMAARLARDGARTALFKDLRGGHDEIWQEGEGVARMILAVLAAIRDGT